MVESRDFMDYQEYGQVKKGEETSPLGKYDFDTAFSSQSRFYQDLNQIAISRHAVLAEILQMSLKEPSKQEAALARGLDILFSCLGLLSCSLPFLVISLAIKLDSEGPVFYRQKRVGKGKKVFQILKFRTMFKNAEYMTGPIWAKPDDPRVTRLGTVLRRTKLDGLPQLFNILLGDMTFIGPCPERPEFVHAFIKSMPAFDRRHDVKPGLTGFAQLRNGYDDSAASVYRKLRWDIQYTKRKCLRTDLWLMGYTVVAVLRRKGQVCK